MNSRVIRSLRQGSRATIVMLILAGLAASACGRTQAKLAPKNEPAKIERIEGTNLSRVRLSEQAAQRLGIQTGPVREIPVVRKAIAPGGLVVGVEVAGAQVAAGESGAPPRKVIPYAAVFYDTKGDTWTYTNPQPLVYVRQRIKVDYVDGDMAVLLDGPPANTPVVIVGAPELFGAETGVGH